MISVFLLCEKTLMTRNDVSNMRIISMMQNREVLMKKSVLYTYIPF